MNHNLKTPTSGRRVRAMRGLQSLLLAILVTACVFGSLSRTAWAAKGDITTIAGNGARGSRGDGGAATAAAFYSPFGIALDSAGNLFIADYGNNRVRRVDATTKVITTVAGTGNQGFSGDGVPATAATLNSPFGVAVDNAGNIFISDHGNNRIRKVDATTKVITTVAGNGNPGFGGDGGAASAALINGPDGLSTDSAGNLFFADGVNNRIRRVDAATKIISTVAGTGNQGFSGDGGSATAATLNSPSDAFVDSAGNLFISDYVNNRIRKVDATTKIITTVAGNGNQGFSGDGGRATSATLNSPSDTVVDSAGNLFISDSFNNRVRRVDATTKVITTVAGTGTAGFGGDNGPATAAALNSPDGVAIDDAGNLFINDSINNRIRRVEGIAVTPNRAPIANDQSITTKQDVAKSGVLTATDANAGDTLTYAKASNPANGSVALNSDGTFTYTPNAAYRGPDSFTFVANDGKVNSSPATVSITVTEALSLVVTTLADDSTNTDGLTSLREAINFANSTATTTAQTISFDVTGTIRLNSTLPSIADAGTSGALTISNAQMGGVTISGDANNNGTNESGDVRLFVVNSGANLSLDKLTLSGAYNANFASQGGAIYNEGTLAVTNCTFSNNTSGNTMDNPGLGGAIASTGTLTVSNSTFSGNRARNAGGDYGDGGAINSNGRLTVFNSTFALNTANRGGGIYASGAFVLVNSIVAGNVSDTNSAAPNLGGDVPSGGSNLTLGDPKLGALADNGGPTQTMALQSGSPAANAGDPAFNGAGQFDQRGAGFARVQGGRLDIGAYEVQNDAPTDIALSSNRIAENNAANATVGTLSSTDPNTGDSFTYSLVSGGGDTDNAAFNISGVALRATGSFDFETKRFYSVRVRSTDQFNAFFEKVFVIAATNANESPTAVALNPSSIAENNVPNATVGTLTTMDPDMGDIFNYVLAGGADDAAFTIVGDKLHAKSALDFETKSSYAIAVKSTDAGGLSVTQNLTVTVTDVNDAPIASGDAYTVPFLVTSTIKALGVLSNDSDADANTTLTVFDADTSTPAIDPVTGPQHGTLSLNADGSFTYTPNFAFAGDDSFTYQATDGALKSNEATVALNIGPNTPPVAVDDSAATDEDNFVDVEVIANDTDVESDNADLSVVSDSIANVTGGTAELQADNRTVRFTPARNANDGNTAGGFGFTYKVTDGVSPSLTAANVTVAVNAVNDSPVATSQDATTNEDSALSGTLAATDVEGNTLTFASASAPTHGTVVVNSDGTFTYTPAANTNGADSFTFTANDGTLDSAPATVTLNVAAVNDAPSFVGGADQSAGSNSGAQKVQGFATEISAGPADEANQKLNFVVTTDNPSLFRVAPAINGNGALTYTLAPNQFGTANVTVTLKDDGGTLNDGKDTSAAQTFAINVRDTNIAFSVSLQPRLVFTRDTLTATPSNAKDANVTFLYEYFVNNVRVQRGSRGLGNTLDLRQRGLGDKGDTIKVVVTATNRTNGDSGQATNSVLVSNSAPVATGGTASAKSGVETLIALNVNGAPGASDIDGDFFIYRRAGLPSNGTAVFETRADGTAVLHYTPKAGFIGTADVKFYAVDGDGAYSNAATIRVTVSANGTSSASAIQSGSAPSGASS